jgi:DHA1 family inner membrane transport protein
MGYSVLNLRPPLVRSTSNYATFNSMTNIEPFYSGGPLYSRLVVLAAALFVVATNGFLIAGLLPQIADDLDVDVPDVGYAITFYAATVAVAAPAASIVFARVSRTRLMTIGLVLVSTGTALSAVAPTLQIFIAGRVLAALGGAAVVPIATAAAAAIAAPERRGRAIGLVVVGFTASIAFGAPIGTALASVGGWRLPLLGVVGLALVIAALVAVLVRRVPIDPPISIARRFGVLANSRLLLALLTTVIAIAGFNVVYIFSSAVVEPATGGDGSAFALLLLIYGVAGLVGNSVGGQLTDRIGPRRVSAIFIGSMAIVLMFVPLVATSMAGLAIAFALWGFTSNGALPAIQYRQITIDPTIAGIALSWSSTALYVGIAFAPPIGDLTLQLGGPALVPIVGAVTGLISLVTFQLSWARRRAKSLASPAKS